MDYRAFLKRLHEELWWREFVEKELKPGIPEVPAYNPSKDNTERWRYDSAMAEGYRLCLQNLGIKGASNDSRS